MKLLTLIILATLALGSKASKRETVFSGKISATSSMMPILFGLNIEFRVDTFVIARAMVQQDGSFTISAPSNTGFDMYYSGVGIRETYVQAIQPAIIDSVSLAFKLPKVYKKHFGKPVCPKCNKQNKTVSIRYGAENAVRVQNIDENGHIILKPYDDKYYYEGGCISSDLDPMYFCKRDKIKF
jgi:hypothetical protein